MAAIIIANEPLGGSLEERVPKISFPTSLFSIFSWLSSDKFILHLDRVQDFLRQLWDSKNEVSKLSINF